MEKRKHRGALIIALGAALLLAGALLLRDAGDGLQYILPAPQMTESGGELEALYEDGQKQLAGMADSFTDYAVGARLQQANLVSESGQSAQTAVYAVGEGYFDVMHETLRAGRYISAADVARGESAIVIDERTALAFFAGDDPLGQTVALDGHKYEVAGVIAAGRRLGERDEHVAYVPITTASRNGLQMDTVELNAHGVSAVGSAILMEDTLSAWKRGGSFYSFGKLALGAAMPLRWALLFVGAAVLLSLLARLNAAAWGRVCHYARQLKTRYARSMIGGMAASAVLCLLGYAALAGAAFLLAKFSIEPLYVFTEWVPEVVVELSSLAGRFWSLNDMNAAPVRYVSRTLCQIELGRGLLRWGMAAALLGLLLHGVPWLNRRVDMPEMDKDR